VESGKRKEERWGRKVESGGGERERGKKKEWKESGKWGWGEGKRKEKRGGGSWERSKPSGWARAR